MNKAISSRFCRIVAAIAWGMVLTVQDSRAGELLQCSSVYTKAGVRVQGTATPFLLENGDIAILTSRHVSGGDPGSFLASSAEGIELQTGARCADPLNDVELLILKKNPAIKPFGTYRRAKGHIEVPVSELKNWHPQSEPASGIGGLLSLAWRSVTGTSKTVLARVEKNPWEPSREFRPAEALIPEWVSKPPKDAPSYPVRLEGTTGPHSGSLLLTRSGSEWVSLARIEPGMSGAPLVEFDWSERKNPKAKIVGIASRVMRDNDRSYFVSDVAIRRVLERYLSGECAQVKPALYSASWDYKVAESGEGLTFRTFSTPFGTIREINPIAARAGSVLSVLTGNGGSSDGGNGGSSDGGNRSVSATLRSVGYDPKKEAPRIRDGRNIWERFEISPGLEVNGKTAVAIEITEKNPPHRKSLLYADASAIELLARLGDSVDARFLTDKPDFVSMLRTRLGKGQGCFRIKAPSGARFADEMSDEPNFSHGKVVDSGNMAAGTWIDVGVNDIRVHVQPAEHVGIFPAGAFDFTLDRGGVMKGGSDHFFVPVIAPKTRQGREFVVDLTRLFFVDASQLLEGDDPFDQYRGGTSLSFREKLDRFPEISRKVFELPLPFVERRPCSPESCPSCTFRNSGERMLKDLRRDLGDITVETR